MSPWSVVSSPCTAPTMSAASATPITAPVVSIARWRPKARPRASGAVESAMRASRGAVRMPLPIRSPTRATRTSGQAVATMYRALEATEAL